MTSTAQREPRVDPPVVPRDEHIAAETVIADRYRVLSLIGCGGMGSVYLAENMRAGGTVAIKVLRFEWSRNPALARRFRNEARLANYAEHPNIVKVLDCSELPDGRFYLVMEFVTGTTLAAELDATGAMTVGRACRILRAIACAVNASHTNDVVHRDLKTENVMLTHYDGDDGEFVKVVDFGVSALIEEQDTARLTRPGQSVGTPEYMAPEQAMGKPPSLGFDIYALGVLMYEMLVGEPPFSGGGAIEIMARKAMEPAPSLVGKRDDIPLQLAFLVDDCLQRDPTKRPSSAAEFLRRIDEILRTVGREEAAGFGIRPKPPDVDTTYSLTARGVARDRRAHAQAKARRSSEQSSLAAGPSRPGPRLDLRPLPEDRIDDADGVVQAPHPRKKTVTPPTSSPAADLSNEAGVVQPRHANRRPDHDGRPPGTPPPFGVETGEGARAAVVAAGAASAADPSGNDNGRIQSAAFTTREARDELTPSVGGSVVADHADAPEDGSAAGDSGRRRHATSQSLGPAPLPSVNGSNALALTDTGRSHGSETPAPPAAPHRTARRGAAGVAMAGVGIAAIAALGWVAYDEGLIRANNEIMAAAADLSPRSAEQTQPRANARTAPKAEPPGDAASEPDPREPARDAAPEARPSSVAPDGESPAKPDLKLQPDPATVLDGQGRSNAAADPPPDASATPVAKSDNVRRQRPRRIPMHEREPCPSTRAEAVAAQGSHKWRTVLAHTEVARCWAKPAHWAALRAEALFQLGRWDECVRAARRGRGTKVSKLRNLCTIRRDRDAAG